MWLVLKWTFPGYCFWWMALIFETCLTLGNAHTPMTFSFFYVLWLVFLCSIQVRIAPTVTTWSNKTPTALPSHPPAASPSDTQVYPSLSLFEQSSAHLNMYVVMYLLPTSLEFPTPICLSAYCILVLLGGKKQVFFFVFFLFVCLFCF